MYIIGKAPIDPTVDKKSQSIRPNYNTEHWPPLYIQEEQRRRRIFGAIHHCIADHQPLNLLLNGGRLQSVSGVLLCK